MKIQLISDLHLEFHPDYWAALNSLEIVPDCDVLVVAGDLAPIVLMSVVKDALIYFSGKARYVIYVEGNHEYYGSSPEAVDRVYSAWAPYMPGNVFWLRNRSINLDGVHFFAGTMWFNNPDQLNYIFQKRMNDFHQISGFVPWVYEQNQIFNDKAAEFITARTVVITHHLPHSKSTPEQFKRDQLNRFFVNDQTKLIEKRQPQLWMHGHTHFPCDYKLGNTRVVCNPFSYPYEREHLGEYKPVVIDV